MALASRLFQGYRLRGCGLHTRDIAAGLVRCGLVLVLLAQAVTPVLAEESAADRSMADAAWWQVGVSVIGLIGIIGALALSIAQNRTATKALVQSESTSRKELRAYLSIAPAGVSRMKRIEPRIIGHIELRNVGQVFATNAKMVVKMQVSSDRALSVFAVDEAAAENIGTVHPGAIVRRGADEGAPPPRKPPIGTKTYIYVWGGVWYDDGFGEQRVTKFCHRYNVASRSPGPSFVIEPEKARYHNHGPSEAS